MRGSRARVRCLPRPPRRSIPPFPGCFANDPPADFVSLLEEIAADVRPESVRTQLLVLAEADQRDLSPDIAVPTLLIWGELDARSPLSVAHQLERAIPHAKLVVIPAGGPLGFTAAGGSGHLSNLEQPEQFNEAMREFCRSHSPRQPRRRAIRPPRRLLTTAARLT